jgi:ABC-type phosphate transport system substrate-binding protein
MTTRLAWGLLLVTTLSPLVGCGAGDKIIRVSRQNNSGTYHYFREAVLGENEFKLGSIDQSGSKDVVELVSKTPNAIGYSGMGYATDEVKMLKVAKDSEAIAPTVENALDGSYPLARPLNIYILGEAEGAVKHYLEWIKSDEGQAIVTEIGYVPAPGAGGPPPSEDPPEGSIKISGSDTMVNLAQAWAETYSMKYPQVRPEVSGGGSGVGIAGLIDGSVQMANASRDMKAEEAKLAEEKQGNAPTVHVVALDALAVYVHKENPVTEITIADLAQIYGDGGTIVDWSQVPGWPK